MKNFRTENNPPASKASREVAKLKEIKNPHIHVYGDKEFVCLSIKHFDPNYRRSGKIEWAAKSFETSLTKS